MHTEPERERPLPQRTYSCIDGNTWTVDPVCYKHDLRNFGERFQVAVGVRLEPSLRLPQLRLTRPVHLFSSMRVLLE